jgi:type VI secretion system FHA domain protein
MALSVKLYRKVGGRLNLVGARTLESASITFGRGAECSVALEDPKKHISRVHAEIAEEESGSYWLKVVSKVNPVFANGQRHGPGSRINLRAGDRFELGDYEIEILPPEATPPPQSELLEVLRARVKGIAPARVEKEAEAAPAPARAEPAAEAKAEATTPPAPVPEEPVPETAAPEGVDILLEPEAPPAPAETAPEPAPAETAPEPAPAERDVFAEATFLGKAPPPEPGVFEEPTVTEAPAAAAKPAETKPAPKHEDIFSEATFLGEKPPPGKGIFDEPTLVGGPPAQAEAKTVFEEPTYVGPKPEVTQPQPSDARARYDPGLERALKAFLDGAGLTRRELASAEEVEQFLRQCGGIVRAAVEGVMALLVARAEAKKEFRAEERTMVASRDNNPLKLMADPQEAIDFLFDIKERGGGFLNPVQAVGDAFEDLRAHEAALIAGMRAAILGAIRRFDPKMLEAELEKSAGGGFSLNRKAKLWDEFAAYQQKLARDAEDDFNKVFGREFMGTYMAQVRQLRGGK